MASCVVMQARSFETGFTDSALTRLLPLLNTAVVLWGWFTVSPLGVHGEGLYGLVLMILGSLAMSLRLIPTTLLPPRSRFVMFALGGIVCGLLFAFDSTGAATAFAPILAGTAGMRLPSVPAVVVAAVTSITAFVAVCVRTDTLLYWPLLVGLAVLIGLTRRDRIEALRLVQEKLEQTQRAVASESRAQILAERARVAREIHDVLAHALSGVNMQLNLADALLEGGRADAGRDAVSIAQKLVADGLVEARKAVYALRDERRELVPTIRALLLTDRETLSVVGRERALESSLSDHLVRIVGEALTNARRHAPGADVDVTVEFGSDRLRIDVVNPMTTAHSFVEGAGVGLTGMHERAAEIGAQLSAQTDAAGIWTVRVEVNL